MRTFIAVPVSSHLATRGADSAACAKDCVKTISEALSELASLGPEIRAVKAENLHITIKFLGEIEEGRLADVIRAMATSVQQQPCFAWQASGVGVFSHHSRTTVVWAAIAPGKAFQNLTSILDKQLCRLGFECESRSLTPHLTFARVKGPTPAALDGWLERHRNIRFGGGTVRCLELVASENTSTGPCYSVLASVPLPGPSNT